MKLKYFIAHDFGTSGAKSILIDEVGTILAHTIFNYSMQTPHPGWVEQLPEDYWQAAIQSTQKLMLEAKVEASDIKGIVFTTQAMGVIPVDVQGNVLHPNISWVDGRAEEEAVLLMRKFGGKKIFKAIVGIEITGKDVIPKLIWLKLNRPEIYQKTHHFLDVNGYLKFKCTGKMVAEWSGACSYAFNLNKKDWERIFFRIAGVDLKKLPPLVKSTDNIGGLTETAAAAFGLLAGTPVYGGCDDTQSAAIGSGAIGEGQGHIYLGTAAQLTFTTSKAPKFKNGAVALQSADPQKNIVVGVTEAAGVNVDWFIKQFYAAELASKSASELFEQLESEMHSISPGSDHLIFTPWFLGERCPVSTTVTRSTLFNLSHEHTRGHLARALCEGIAYNIRWKLEIMEHQFGFKQDELRIIGGGSQNDTWMQILANVTQKKIVKTNQPRHAGAIGGAMCAMVGSGVYPNFESVHQLIQPAQIFQPQKEHFDIYDTLFLQYKSLYHSLKNLYSSANQNRF